MSDPLHLQEQINALAGVRRFLVAFSGGMDSSVLLHALVACRNTGCDPDFPEIIAVHIDHGLQQEAGEWTVACRAAAEALSVSFRLSRVRVDQRPGTSLEEQARLARYRALGDLVQPGDVVLTAHHADDQLETFLLQLFRGGGPAGLAAMPATSDFYRGRLMRPLLHCQRSELAAYADEQGLDWVDDSSNRDRRFDRNFLRHDILPLLQQRWPALASTVSRAAMHQAAASTLLGLMASEDLPGLTGSRSDCLSVQALCRLDSDRQQNVLRHWIKTRGLPVPGTRQLRHIISDVVHARPDGNARVVWGGAEVRRYRDDLYVMSCLQPVTMQARYNWDGNADLDLKAGTLQGHAVLGDGIRAAACAGKLLNVRFRRGGELCRPAGRSHHKSLKKLFQERGIPPWQRARIPLIYLDDDLVAVADLWVCHPYAASGEQQGLSITWTERGS